MFENEELLVRIGVMAPFGLDSQAGYNASVKGTQQGDKIGLELGRHLRGQNPGSSLSSNYYAILNASTYRVRYYDAPLAWWFQGMWTVVGQPNYVGNPYIEPVEEMLQDLGIDYKIATRGGTRLQVNQWYAGLAV